MMTGNGWWSRKRLSLLIRGEFLNRRLDERGNEWEWYDEAPTAYELRCRAIDEGKPELVLDAIVAESLLDEVPSPHERAVLTLLLCGWREDEVGTVLGQHRIEKLVERGIASLERSSRFGFFKWISKR